MIHKLTGGLWGEEARPVLRRIAGLLPLMLLSACRCWRRSICCCRF